MFLDPTYTGKAMAGLIARIRGGEFDGQATVLFWHTGGQVNLFALSHSGSARPSRITRKDNLASITFLGASQTVTGSRYLLDTGTSKVLVDAGLFQGLKELRLRNWQPLPVDPKAIDAIVLTDAHLDYFGDLPRLVAQGFRGRVFAPPARSTSAGLCCPMPGGYRKRTRPCQPAWLFETQPRAAALHRGRRVSRRLAAAAGRLLIGRCRLRPTLKSSSSTPGTCSVASPASGPAAHDFFGGDSVASAGPCCPIRRRSLKRTTCWWNRPTEIGCTSRTMTARNSPRSSTAPRARWKNHHPVIRNRTCRRTDLPVEAARGREADSWTPGVRRQSHGGRGAVPLHPALARARSRLHPESADDKAPHVPPTTARPVRLGPGTPVTNGSCAPSAPRASAPLPQPPNRRR